MPRRRRLYNTIRTDTLESMIALYEAQRRYDASAALRYLARQIMAPIAESEIERHKATYQQVLVQDKPPTQ